jgi:hypothetical protein
VRTEAVENYLANGIVIDKNGEPVIASVQTEFQQGIVDYYANKINLVSSFSEFYLYGVIAGIVMASFLLYCIVLLVVGITDPKYILNWGVIRGSIPSFATATKLSFFAIPFGILMGLLVIALHWLVNILLWNFAFIGVVALYIIVLSSIIAYTFYSMLAVLFPNFSIRFLGVEVPNEETAQPPAVYAQPSAQNLGKSNKRDLEITLFLAAIGFGILINLATDFLWAIASADKQPLTQSQWIVGALSVLVLVYMFQWAKNRLLQYLDRDSI